MKIELSTNIFSKNALTSVCYEDLKYRSILRKCFLCGKNPSYCDFSWALDMKYNIPLFIEWIELGGGRNVHLCGLCQTKSDLIVAQPKWKNKTKDLRELRKPKVDNISTYDAFFYEIIARSIKNYRNVKLD